VDDEGGLEAVVEAVAARHDVRLPDRRAPAGGAEIPTFLSYSTEKRLTKYPEEFGKGAIEGVAGPEAANNASAAGTLVPLLTLGLPTSATAAMMLAGFQQYGPEPGTAAVRRAARLWCGA
jgi:TctA family transporter